MAYFKTCPYCGASLDPDEKCDCEKESLFIARESLTDYLGCHKKITITNMVNIERSTTNDQETC